RPPPDLHSFPTRRSSDLLARRSAADLVDRRARHAPRNSRARPAPSGEPEAPPAAADPLVVGIPAAGADDPDRGDVQRAGDRIVRDRKSTRLNSSHVSISY